MKHHTYSVERLHHFNCAICESWWSIGDYKPILATLFCPYCGKKAAIKPIEENTPWTKKNSQNY